MTDNALMILDNPAREIAMRGMRELRLQAGERVFLPGDSCSNFLIVKSGSVRVTVTTDSGRDILLYRVEPGESCVLTTACLMSGSEYEAEGRADGPTDAYILPKPVFEELLATSAQFRQFVFSSYGGRLHSLIALIQEITVKHVDRRLAQLLVARAEGEVVPMTHQMLADELNTAREVVTRLLHDFAERGWVRLGRGTVHVVNQHPLAEFAGTV